MTLNVSVAIAFCLLIARIGPVKAESQLETELKQATEQLAALIGDEVEGREVYKPIIIPAVCAPNESALCDPAEAVVPFDLIGSRGSTAFWTYLAHFRILPTPDATEQELRET